MRRCGGVALASLVAIAVMITLPVAGAAAEYEYEKEKEKEKVEEEEEESASWQPTTDRCVVYTYYAELGTRWAPGALREWRRSW